MINEYTEYAHIAKSRIQNLNDNLQLDFERYYSNIESNSDILKTQIVGYIEEMHDIAIDYFNHIKAYYESFHEIDDFTISDKLEEIISGYFDTINFESPLDILPENVSISYMKYFNINFVYDNIIENIITDNHDDEDCDNHIDRSYGTQNVITIIDFVFDYFEDWINTVNQTCENNSNLFSVLKYYICELQLISYIIEFLESIEHK